MKKLLGAFLVLFVGLLFAQPVNAEFTKSIPSYDTGGKWVEAGTTFTYRTGYYYKCVGTNYVKQGVMSGSVDVYENKSKFVCDDGQEAKYNNVSNEYHTIV